MCLPKIWHARSVPVRFVLRDIGPFLFRHGKGGHTLDDSRAVDKDVDFAEALE
jgi:hypothetical protein